MALHRACLFVRQDFLSARAGTDGFTSPLESLPLPVGSSG
ncbi:hypothetical protein LV92_04380 [Arenibacter echinorum]|uniref:Uncharacterized protein n=1 Tax=Arenibacter echinorum TaxID=440515 RepID=A0A327QSN6_9FLAO|nr:hypothetical protein LV92_04380 [Arenibacter echinorum]